MQRSFLWERVYLHRAQGSYFLFTHNDLSCSGTRYGREIVLSNVGFVSVNEVYYTAAQLLQQLLLNILWYAAIVFVVFTAIATKVTEAMKVISDLIESALIKYITMRRDYRNNTAY